MSGPPSLIVNADDLGMAPGINRAIFAAHERGIVTSASLMALGSAFDDALLGLARHPRLGVGVHLVLHGERPLCAPERIPALVGDDGRLLPLRRVLARLALGRLPRAQIEAELAAQIERVRAAGVQPTHLDSHCHLHAFPGVGRVVHALGARLGVACARKAELGSAAELFGAAPGRIPLGLAITACHRIGAHRGAAGLRTPDRLLGLLRSGSIEIDWLVARLAALPAGSVTELMVHPGDGADGAHGGDFGGDHGARARHAELEALTSPMVAEAVRRAGVELVSYRHLAP
ncbi:MAG TPA: ChbG/HpnK family deacetylase [Planctomycetota bacterium]|nr:ChbG/HpnK family deacetylase [Planctomycetota bacterium]